MSKIVGAGRPKENKTRRTLKGGLLSWQNPYSKIILFTAVISGGNFGEPETGPPTRSMLWLSFVLCNDLHNFHYSLLLKNLCVCG